MAADIEEKDGDALLPLATLAGALRNSGLPILHAGEGMGAKLPPPLVAGTKGTLLLRPFPLFLLAVRKFSLAGYIRAPVEGL